ncbi:MAG: DegT/DnrJ/EryC1/StrS family aminotransferase [Candidatus Brocadiales bacterium]|nr:DegT/DnrJ/EryC1/StrS family aminotransferase [Candidatus Brocadiales bacterium]
MDPQKVHDFLEKDCQWINGELRNRITGRRVRAIIPVHILGHPVDLQPILVLARQYDLTVIEDATESLGARYKNKMVGGLADIACFSFNGNKIITTGGGGMIVTNNEAWAKKARYLTTQAKDNALEFIHNEVGYNYRLTNIQAALGCSQLELLPEYIDTKRRIANMYNDSFRNIIGITPMREAEWAYSVSWMYTMLIDSSLYGFDSRTLIKKLAAKEIQARPLWQPIHLSKAHQGSYAVDCSVAERLNRDAISLPCSVGLLDQEQEQVINMITVRKHEKAGEN